MIDNIITHLKFGFAILFAIVIFGTLGFELIEEDFDFLDSFYMTIITISTTGNSQSFGDLTQGRNAAASTSNA